MSARGYSVTIDNITVMSGAKNQWSSSDWVVFILRYIGCWGIESVANVITDLNGKGVYKASLTINYNRKETTCAPESHHHTGPGAYD